MPEMLEATKNGARNTIFSMVSVVVTYFVNSVLPQDIPGEVRLAIVGLILAGVTYGITWIDSWIHTNKTIGPDFIKKANGILPF